MQRSLASAPHWLQLFPPFYQREGPAPLHYPHKHLESSQWICQHILEKAICMGKVLVSHWRLAVKKKKKKQNNEPSKQTPWRIPTTFGFITIATGNWCSPCSEVCSFHCFHWFWVVLNENEPIWWIKGQVFWRINLSVFFWVILSPLISIPSLGTCLEPAYLCLANVKTIGLSQSTDIQRSGTHKCPRTGIIIITLFWYAYTIWNDFHNQAN